MQKDNNWSAADSQMDWEMRELKTHNPEMFEKREQHQDPKDRQIQRLRNQRNALVRQFKNNPDEVIAELDKQIY